MVVVINGSSLRSLVVLSVVLVILFKKSPLTSHNDVLGFGNALVELLIPPGGLLFPLAVLDEALCGISCPKLWRRFGEIK